MIKQRNCGFYALLTGLSLSGLLMASPAFAGQSANPDLQSSFGPPPELKQKNFIPGALQVQISPRGLEIFKTKLRSMIITQAALDPAEIPLDPFTKEWDQAIKWDDLQSSPESKALVKMVREMLSKWLVGFSLNDLRPQLQVGDSMIVTKYSRFALVTDEALLRSLGKNTGAVLALELEIKESNVSTSYLKFFDLNNTFLKAQVQDLSLKIAGGNTPLKLRLPFYVKINEKNSLEFEALKIESNLNNIDLQLKYSNLLVPNVEIHIDDQVFKMNKSQLDAQITANLPAALVQIRSFISGFATSELPKILNEKAQQLLGKTLEEIQPINAPGSDNPQDHFFWGLQLAGIQQNQNLQVKLNAFAEDEPQYAKLHTPPKKEQSSRGAPNLNVVKPEAYDVGVSVDRGLINRLLQLSFERKFFEKIPVQKNMTLKLTQSPTVDAAPGVNGIGANPKSTMMKIQVALKIPAGIITGLQKLAIKDQFEMSMEILARLEEKEYPTCGTRAGEKGIAILLTKINLDSVFVDDQWFTFPIGKLFKGAVMDAIKKTLTDISKDWAGAGQSIGGCFTPPREILGLKLDVGQIGMDPKGHLLIYFDYARSIQETGR